MCRWAAYIGQPTLLGDIISHPEHSLIAQSQHATQSTFTTNADGFGVAWYGASDLPGVFRDIHPAWSDRNLRSLADHVSSNLFISHIRASTASPTSRENCHPFTAGRWSFVHNGQLGDFPKFRHEADTGILPEHYAYREGSTDSEALFLTALGEGIDDDPKGALERASGKLETLSRAKGTAPYLHMSVAFSCGKKLYVARYASDGNDPTVYHRWSPELQGHAVVSEPLNLKSGWEEVPPGSFCVFDGKSVDIQPFSPVGG
ncbi:class II glutamine amidotransferase [Aliiroseovarius sp. 2305UL8-7]|uniref:class II glutamine amidotransferase n=1 Tax=Aliiroseovarius conchicola TaxID=3121637 RepID=UPI003528ED84